MGGCAIRQQALEAKVDTHDYAARDKAEKAVVEHRCDDANNPAGRRQAVCPNFNDM